MKSYRLSLQAQGSLEDIFVWTIEQFGLAQAITYKDQLIKRLDALAAGIPPHGRPCTLLVSEVSDVKDLEYYREGRHYIIFRNTETSIFVANFVHGSRNLEEILNELTDLD